MPEEKTPEERVGSVAPGNKYLKQYPFPELRPGVKELFEALETYSDKRFFIIRGKTGVGKSGLSIAISRVHGCHILTATKLLQDQYANTAEFNSEFVMKGKSNYTCHYTGKSMSDAPCSSNNLFKIGKAKYSLSGQNPKDQKNVCMNSFGCEYYVKKRALAESGGGILNYDLAMLSVLSKEAIVMDEAHNFIDKILDTYTIDISRAKLESLLDIDDTPNQTTYVEWLKSIVAKASVKFELAGVGAAREQLRNLRDKANGIINESPKPGDFFVEVTSDHIQIKPLIPRKIAMKFLSKFKKVFFLSATLDVDFASLLGLPAKDTLEFNIDSTFPVENRPIYFPKDIPNINFATKIDKSMPQIVLLNKIIETHKDRGIIHTANYRIFDALQVIYKKNKRFTWAEQGQNKSELLEKHAAKPGSILVSPSMIEGVDLKDELARWQVIFKIPFPAKTDYIDALEQSMPGLYAAITRNALVQAYGRAVRTEKDWAHTYVLDGSLKFQLQKIDSYFAKAVKVGEWEKLVDALSNGKIGLPLGD